LIITGHELFPAKEHAAQEKLTRNPGLQRPFHAGESRTRHTTAVKNSWIGSGVTGLLSQHLGGRGRRISEFEASLVYKVSSRTARATQRNPVSKKNKKQNKQTNKQNPG
jgi:hypothetical protein